MTVSAVAIVGQVWLAQYQALLDLMGPATLPLLSLGLLISSLWLARFEPAPWLGTVEAPEGEGNDPAAVGGTPHWNRRPWVDRLKRLARPALYGILRLLPVAVFALWIISYLNSPAYGQCFVNLPPGVTPNLTWCTTNFVIGQAVFAYIYFLPFIVIVAVSRYWGMGRAARVEVVSGDAPVGVSHWWFAELGLRDGERIAVQRRGGVRRRGQVSLRVQANRTKVALSTPFRTAIGVGLGETDLVLGRRRIWPVWPAALMLLLTVVPTVFRALPLLSQEASTIEQCRTGGPAMRLKACTALLDDPNIPQQEMAAIRLSRGWALLPLRWEEALSDFNEAIHLDPTLWGAYAARSELLAQRREYAKAAADIDSIMRGNPGVATLHWRRAILLDNAGQSTAALADFGRAITLVDPLQADGDTMAGLYRDRGATYEGAGQYDKAVDDYDQSLRWQTNAPLTLYGRGRSQFLRGNGAAAASDLMAAADIEPGDPYTLLWLYLALRREGRDAAAELRARAVEVDMRLWPGPIIQVFLGEASPETAAAWKEPFQPQLQYWPADVRDAGRRCELSFFLAELRLIEKKPAEAKALFQAAIDTGIVEFIEYRAAVHELKRLNGHD